MAYYSDIVEVEGNELLCVLCRIPLPDNDSKIETHLIQRNHIEMFMNRLLLQNNIVLNESNVCCLLCRSFIKPPEITEHIKGPNHQNIINQINHMILKDGELIKLPVNLDDKPNIAQCLVCDRDIEFRLETISDHIKSQRHKRSRSIIVQPYHGIFSVEGTNDDLWCKICQIYFENYVETILEHVDKDPIHNKKIGKILNLINGQSIEIEKYLTDPKEDKAVCNKCKIEVSCNVINLHGHINGKKHKN